MGSAGVSNVSVCRKALRRCTFLCCFVILTTLVSSSRDSPCGLSLQKMVETSLQHGGWVPWEPKLPLPDFLGPELDLLPILIVKASHKQAKIQEEGRKILHLLQRGVRCDYREEQLVWSSLGTMHYIPSSWFCFLLRSYHSALSYLLCVSYTGWTLSFYSLLHPRILTAT